jgi:type I restriction enzyme R subunit
MYGYLSQIINFTDIELEKTFVFLRFLNKKLPKRETDKFDLSDSIDLDSLRIQKIHEHIDGLTPEDATVTPPTFEPTGVKEPTYDLLSEIITQVNSVYGVNLTEDDQLNLSRLSKRLSENPDVQRYMNGNNTEDNKKHFFKQQFEGMMVDYINERFDFYKKMEENPSMKNLIFRLMYDSYNNKRPSP